jgi:23S rRNA (adenine2503-C2)-methyltransferase
MDLQLLEETLADHAQPRFRARQVWAWTSHGASSYAEMTDLPAELRTTLERELPFSSLTLTKELRARDGTVKALFRTADAHPLEAVMMRFAPPRRPRPNGRGAALAPRSSSSPRASVCLSSQSGCPLTCSFCATGAMRFARNLSASEILDQALHFRRERRGQAERLTHCVFMGMGEPMHNLDNVLAACERLPDLGIGHRNTTVSTVGWIPGIERLAAQDMPLRLALSLHAAEDALRSQLMPVNERFPVAEVIDACRAFYARKRRRVFVEYVMLGGVNDRYEQAVALAAALSGSGARDPSIFKVNLIPYNPTSTAVEYRCSSRDAIDAFREVLVSRGIPTTVRLTRGREIEAACGQLAAGGVATAKP